MIELPPLPKAACSKSGTRQPSDLFTLEQVVEYGQQCLNAATVMPALRRITQEQAEAFAHRRATKYTHRSAPTYHSYAFVPHTLMDFVADIEMAIRGES